MNRDELIKKHLNVIGVNVMDSAEKHADCTIQAMETYATQQTADLSTQLAKANSDKERLGKILKEENEELKRLLVQILKLDIQEDYYKMHIVEPITDLLTKHSK
jgi:hypothetical protein